MFINLIWYENSIFIILLKKNFYQKDYAVLHFNSIKTVTFYIPDLIFIKSHVLWMAFSCTSMIHVKYSLIFYGVIDGIWLFSIVLGNPNYLYTCCYINKISLEKNKWWTCNLTTTHDGRIGMLTLANSENRLSTNCISRDVVITH